MIVWEYFIFTIIPNQGRNPDLSIKNNLLNKTFLKPDVKIQ